MSKKILIIEDDDDTRLLLEEIFIMQDCDVSCAATVAEVTQYLNKDSGLDLIISDLMVPGAGKNGEIVSLIRSLEGGKKVPIVVLSGHADISEIAKRLDVKYLSKPVDVSELMELVS
jgi:CheY-like chemotaxis protein